MTLNTSKLTGDQIASTEWNESATAVNKVIDQTLVAADVSDFDIEVSNNAAVTANTAKITYPSVDSTKVGYISVTQVVNLDTMESDITTNNTKVTNATHTGDVTGSTTLTIAANAVDDTNIDWGTGVNQVSTADIPEETNLFYTEVRVSANTDVAASKVTTDWISITQAVNLDTIESDTATNNAKITYPSADSTKLAGIEALAEVNNISDVNATDLTDTGDSSLHYHSTDRARTNHTGTQTASTISDFDTEVSNNSSVTANTAKTGVTTEISNIVEDTTPELGGDLDCLNKALKNIALAEFNIEYDNGNSSTADTIDWNNGNKEKSTLTGNCTYTFTSPSGPCNLTFKVIQDATGSRTVTWPATVKWGAGTAPTLSTAANSIDIVTFYFDGTNYYGVASLDFQ